MTHEVAQRFDQEIEENLRTDRRLIEKRWRESERREAERAAEQHRAIEHPQAMLR